MKNLANRMSMSAQLILLFTGFALLITFIFVVVISKLVTENVKEEIGAQFSEMAVQTTEILDRSLFERYREIQILSKRPMLSDLTVSVEEKRALLASLQTTYGFYAWIGITDTEGKVLATSNGLLEGINVSSRPWFKNALGDVHLTDVHEAVLLGKLLQPYGTEPMRFIDVAFPYKSKEGDVLGVIGAHMSLEWAQEIQKSVLASLERRTLVEAMILSEDLTVIIGPKYLVGKKMTLRSDITGDSNSSGYEITTDENGKDYLIGFSRSHGYGFSPNLGWSVLVRQDVTHAYAVAKAMQLKILLTGLAVAALFAFLGYWIAKRVSTPLCRIAESARKIESGETIHLNPVETNCRELTVMQAALNSLIDKLQVDENAQRLANQRKDEFLATLAHELRNPLAPISTIADMLAVAKPDQESQRRYGEIIERQVRHMTGLINDLLDVSRITRSVVVLDKNVVDMSDVISDALEQIRPLADERSHVIKVSIMSKSLYVTGDRKRLVQIVANLLDNAVKFTPSNGLIELTLSHFDSQVVLAVKDNGIGMSPELIAHAFDLFTQATRKTDRARGGLGVGLALSKSLAELHGGTLSVTSGGQAQGSEFTLRLPKIAVDDVLDGGSIAQAITFSGNGKRVLVLDDNVDAADMLAAFVRNLGFEVAVEYQPEKALELAEKFLPAICLIDIGMPVMDGYEVATRLRKAPLTEDSIIVAVTGYGHQDDKERALRAGFNNHLTKPVNVNELSRILSSYTENEIN